MRTLPQLHEDFPEKEQRGLEPLQSDHKHITIKNKEQFYYCNEGVYLSPNIEQAQKYASKTFLGNIKRLFKFVIMARVNPKRIRDPGIYPANWILSGN